MYAQNGKDKKEEKKLDKEKCKLKSRLQKKVCLILPVCSKLKKKDWQKIDGSIGRFLLDALHHQMVIMTRDDVDMINLCSQLKIIGINVDVARISKNWHSKVRLNEIKSKLQDLLQLLRSGSDYWLQDYDDGKDKVSRHKTKSLYRCRECNRVFAIRADTSKHQSETGHKGTVMSSRFD